MSRVLSFVLLPLFYPVHVAGVGGGNLTVDLGYAAYTGIHDSTTGLDVWKGIRYAAPPVGGLRWQAPQPPNITIAPAAPVTADSFGPACPQAFPMYAHGGAPLFVAGDEDCLFLHVYARAARDGEDDGGSEGLPVVVIIHGGGYGEGDGTQDMSPFINTSNNSFIAVVIQYRLGAFGFLASREVEEKGVLNAGLLDQRAALEWVRDYIGLFGGDKQRVTVMGESAGAGSVLLHVLAPGDVAGGLFQNVIAASLWIPTQPHYSDAGPTAHYNTFAALAGCSPANATLGRGVFDCLVGKDSLTLQYSADLVSTGAPTVHGNWAFIPVTDGSYLTAPPSTLLHSNNTQLNGVRVLAGNNANEGSLIPPSNIVTQDDLVAWMEVQFPGLSTQNITSVLSAYPVGNGTARFETDGYGPATAVDTSQVASGQQQRAYNMYAEASVICPSYWLAGAFSGAGKEAWHYQYSVPFAAHGADLSVYYGPPAENQGADLVTAFRRIYGNFITQNNSSVPQEDAEGDNPANDWPKWTDSNPVMVNLNQSGGEPYTAMTTVGGGTVVTQFRDPGLRNNLTLVNAYTWEGGRGRRCEVWRAVSPFVPQ